MTSMWPELPERQGDSFRDTRFQTPLSPSLSENFLLQNSKWSEIQLFYLQNEPGLTLLWPLPTVMRPPHILPGPL